MLVGHNSVAPQVAGCAVGLLIEESQWEWTKCKESTPSYFLSDEKVFIPFTFISPVLLDAQQVCFVLLLNEDIQTQTQL